MNRQNREAVLRFVAAYPGAHAREVERRLGMSSRLAAYHLEALERDGLVERVEEEGYTRYVARSSLPRITPAELRFICLMRRPPALRATQLLLDHGEVQAGEVARLLELAKPSVRYHLAMLEEARVAKVRPDGRQRWYRLRDPGWVRRALTRFEPIPEEPEAFEAMWDDLLR
ncbi:MAG: MarR family transcriptional regulator [Halobacteriales archaeon]|nr:MarR family transcriptional regulator [Halobacteriales archaeon]